MGVNSLLRIVTRQRSAPESSTLTTRLPSHRLLTYLLTNACFLGRTSVLTPDIISIRLSAFAWLTVVTNRQTDTQTPLHLQQ